ncbi:MAG: sce7726 family protein [Alistipes sp.]|nr:sce7726 family protein [Alistipes sp.]
MKEEDKLRDPDMREILFETYENTGERLRIFEELVIGKSRADAILVKENEILGFEIKSDKDSLVRLTTQVKNYERFCDKCYIVTGVHYIDKIENAVPEHWGIYDIAKDEEGNLHIEMFREAERNPKERPTTKLKNQMNLLWRSELIRIVKTYKMGGVTTRNKKQLRDLIIEKMGKEEAKRLACDALIERDYSIYQQTD